MSEEDKSCGIREKIEKNYQPVDHGKTYSPRINVNGNYQPVAEPTTTARQTPTPPKGSGLPPAKPKN
jgi:hypothetical protein